MKKYNLLLPIAGKAQRFIDAGYTMPKALILAKNKHVIDWAMDSIDTKDCNLIFMVRVDHVYNFSIDKILKQKFGEDITIIKLQKEEPATSRSPHQGYPTLDLTCVVGGQGHFRSGHVSRTRFHKTQDAQPGAAQIAVP